MAQDHTSSKYQKWALQPHSSTPSLPLKSLENYRFGFVALLVLFRLLQEKMASNLPHPPSMVLSL